MLAKTGTLGKLMTCLQLGGMAFFAFSLPKPNMAFRESIMLGLIIFKGVVTALKAMPPCVDQTNFI
jgi:hypothetical protein